MEGSLLYYVVAGLVGGVILNIMPCVLPVLTMKVFNVVEHAGENPRAFRAHALAYTGGILATFGAMAAVVIGLRASGDIVGWGMQFQNPAFVAALTALMVVFGLNALGVFEFSVSLNDRDDDAGYLASFTNGVVASIMATPCSAPFLGTAAAFALGTGAAWWQTLLLFEVIGLGLALPFLLISYIPFFAKILPRPGTWMITFKQLMGFSLMGAAVWLFSVLQKQISPDASAWFLAFLLALALALWSVEHFGGLQHSTRRRAVVRFAALTLTAAAGWAMVDLTPPPPAAATGLATASLSTPVVKDGRINWAPFSSAHVADANARQRPVFIDYTADWCANCKANEKAFIEVARVRDTLTHTQILPMKADLTNDNPEIWAWVHKLNRTAIPVYAIYLPDGSVDLLPVAITTDMLVKRLEQASAKFPPSKFVAQAPPAPSSTQLAATP